MKPLKIHSRVDDADFSFRHIVMLYGLLPDQIGVGNKMESATLHHIPLKPQIDQHHSPSRRDRGRRPTSRPSEGHKASCPRRRRNRQRRESDEDSNEKSGLEATKAFGPC